MLWMLLGCDISANAGSGLALVEQLDFTKARWGTAVPNTIKGMSLAYDAKTDMLLTSGAIRAKLSFIDLKQGHPVAAADVPVSGNPTNRLRVDSDRRRAFWIGLHSEEIRVYDLDSRTLIAKVDGQAVPGEVFAVRDAVIDPKSGWLWVANQARRTVTGYSNDLKQTVTVPDLTGPVALTAAADTIWIVDSAGPENSRIVKFQPSVKGSTIINLPVPPQGRKPRPPRAIAALPDGSLALAAGGVMILDPSGQPGARIPLAGVADSLAVLGNRIAVTYRKPGTAEYQLVWITSGQASPPVSVGFQATQLVADALHDRVFVMQAGDAQILAVDTQGKVTGTYDAGEAPESVAVDPRTGTRYVLDRLGGSSIDVWKPGETTFKSWPVNRWPAELAIDGDRRLLIALAHWDSGLFLWNIDEKKALTSIPSGAPANTGDALGDLDYDASVGLAAVSFPESGFIGVIDVPGGSGRWGKQVEEFKRGPNDGAGLLQVAIDSKNNRLYVMNARPREVVAYDLEKGNEVNRVTLNSWTKEEAAGHIINNLYLDKANSRLFAGADPLIVPALTVGSRLDAQRPFWADEKSVLALKTDDKSQEMLVQYDAKTLLAKATWPLYTSEEIRPQPNYDARNKRLYLSDVPTATVRVYAWPP